MRTLALLLILAVAPPAIAADPLSPEVQALLVKAQAGDIDAQFRVASAYDTGRGAPRNGVEAMKWYRAAADRGHAEAQNSVGSGLQAEERYGEALSWYERAAKQDHPVATNNLAYLYDLGLGVKQDRLKAFELYGRAAELGWPEAMWNIANMYGAGQIGGKKDMFMACIWTLRARSNSEPGSEVFEHAKRVSARLPDVLGRERFSECQQKAGNWAPESKPAAQQGAPADPPRPAGSAGG